ncbi:unnamed protein product [Lota lota]
MEVSLLARKAAKIPQGHSSVSRGDRVIPSKRCGLSSTGRGVACPQEEAALPVLVRKRCYSVLTRKRHGLSSTGRGVTCPKQEEVWTHFNRK